MTESQARNWAYAAAGAGVIANTLFIAFYVGFAVQRFADPRGVTAILGSAADYAGIPQNALLAVITGVAFRFLSRQQRSDQVLRIAGAVAFVTAAAQGVLTVTGLLPGVSAVAVGAVLAATMWLLAIGIRGARLPGPGTRPVARTAWLIAAHDAVRSRSGADRSGHRRCRRRVDRPHRGQPGLAFDPFVGPGHGPGPGAVRAVRNGG